MARDEGALDDPVPLSARELERARSRLLQTSLMVILGSALNVEHNAVRHRSCFMGKWIVIAALLALLAAAIAFAYVGWNLHGEVEMSVHGHLAMALGIGFTALVGVGLMALMFYSSRMGYDEHASRHAGGAEREPRRP